MYFTFFIGTAGSGKSTLVAAFDSWLDDHEYDVAVLNLDPGAVWLPFSPDVDVRNYVDYERIMKTYNLGPNGALIAAVDLLVNHVNDIRRELKDLNPTHVLVDTPGQMELFAFREVGPAIGRSLAGSPATIAFLLDSSHVKAPAAMVSTLLLAASVHFRFRLSQLNILSKTDLLSPEELSSIDSWFEDTSSLVAALSSQAQGTDTTVNQRICEILMDEELLAPAIYTSATTGEGLDNLYASLQTMLGIEEEYKKPEE